MSESLIHIDIAQQINYLAQMAGAKCSDFQHQIINSKVAFTAPTEANIFNVAVNANQALIITAIDVKTLYDVSDAPLNTGDFRSSFDLNPYGPYTGAGAVGQIRLLGIVATNQQYGATAFDIGVINAGVIFVVLANQTLLVKANPNQPVGKNLTLVSRMNCYLVPQVVGVEIKKKETQIITNTP